ncbi:uncharacterized protein VP01_4730g2, partial [Puccinia sorghi]
GQQNPTPAPALSSNPIVLSKPQPFDGTCDIASKAFVGQIGLHAITYPKRFPTDTSKVAFAVLFIKDYTATLSQLYLDKVFNGEPVVFNDLLNDLKYSFFDHNHWHCAKVALRNLHQTGTVLAYMQDLNQHARTIGWADNPLMSLYQNGLKEKIQLAVVMTNIEFDSLRSMQVMALKAGQTIEGIQKGYTDPNPSPVPVPVPLPPTLMQWTSPHSRRPQESNSPTPSKPVHPAEPLFPLRPGGPHILQMFEQGLRAPRPPKALVFRPDLQTSGGNQFSWCQLQRQ